VHEQNGLSVAHDGVSQRQSVTLVAAWADCTDRFSHHFLSDVAILF
jgi:hypothetical protein